MAILDKVYLGKNRWLVEYKDNSGQTHKSSNPIIKGKSP